MADSILSPVEARQADEPPPTGFLLPGDGAPLQLWPMLDAATEAALRASIDRWGVLVPVAKDQHGRMIDGHHRARIAGELGVKYAVIVHYVADDEEARELARTLNSDRRHLTTEQRRDMVAHLREQGHSYRAIGAALGIHKTQAIRDASQVDTVCPPARVTGADGKSYPARRPPSSVAVEDDGSAERTMARAVMLLEQLPQQTLISQRDIMIAERDTKESKREARREDNRAAIASSVATSGGFPAGRFSTIVIDPPWDWGDEGDADQLGRARPTYATMSIDEIASLPVGDIADEDCHAYLWITNRSLPKGFALLEGWGFRYVTCVTWCKPSFGMGNYFRGQTEHVLFGIRGSQALRRADVGTVLNAPRGPRGHSSKPAEFFALVESCSPGPYVELFARDERDGWTVWGGEL